MEFSNYLGQCNKEIDYIKEVEASLTKMSSVHSIPLEILEGKFRDKLSKSIVIPLLVLLELESEIQKDTP